MVANQIIVLVIILLGFLFINLFDNNKNHD